MELHWLDSKEDTLKKKRKKERKKERSCRNQRISWPKETLHFKFYPLTSRKDCGLVGWFVFWRFPEKTFLVSLQMYHSSSHTPAVTWRAQRFYLGLYS